MKYQVDLGAVASQSFSIEAESEDEAIHLAYEQHGLYENVSNSFELGDPLLLGVYDKDGNELVKSELT